MSHVNVLRLRCPHCLHTRIIDCKKDFLAIKLSPLVSTVPTWIKVGVKADLDTPCFF
jgi:hypothetical protein